LWCLLVKTTCKLIFCYQRSKDKIPPEGRKRPLKRNVDNYLQTVTVEFEDDLDSCLGWGKAENPLLLNSDQCTSIKK
jgi:hypothetical protein